MKVETKFQVNQFVSYLKKCDLVSMKSEEISQGVFEITLSDNTTYSMSPDSWAKVQMEVPRINNTLTSH